MNTRLSFPDNIQNWIEELGSASGDRFDELFNNLTVFTRQRPEEYERVLETLINQYPENPKIIPTVVGITHMSGSTIQGYEGYCFLIRNALSFERREYKDAYRYWQRILELDSEKETVYLNCGYLGFGMKSITLVAAREKDWKFVDYVLQEGLQKSPSEPRCFHEIGQMYLKYCIYSAYDKEISTYGLDFVLMAQGIFGPMNTESLLGFTKPYEHIMSWEMDWDLDWTLYRDVPCGGLIGLSMLALKAGEFEWAEMFLERGRDLLEVRPDLAGEKSIYEVARYADQTGLSEYAQLYLTIYRSKNPDIFEEDWAKEYYPGPTQFPPRR